MVEDRRYREHYLQAERTAEQRRKDLVVAFDCIYELRRSRDLQKIWIRVLTLVVTMEGAVIAWLAKELLARL